MMTINIVEKPCQDIATGILRKSGKPRFRESQLERDMERLALAYTMQRDALLFYADPANSDGGEKARAARETYG